MRPELVRDYKHILGTLLNVMVDEQLDYVRTMLERIPDDASDLKAAFRKPETPPVPPHWISIVRIIRLGIALRSEAQGNYDVFVQSYQDLSAKQERDEDEVELVKELGDVLYATDEAVGELDRLVPKLLQEAHKILAARYGMQTEPDDEFYRSTLSREERLIMDPFIVALMELCKKMLQHLRIMLALERVRKLIVNQ